MTGLRGLQPLVIRPEGCLQFIAVRTYIVIPEGTVVLRVDASTPHYAISKAKRGRCEHVAGGCVAVPATAAVEANDRPTVIPGQLRMEGCP
jgi:hypothetical protein